MEVRNLHGQKKSHCFKLKLIFGLFCRDILHPKLTLLLKKSSWRNGLMLKILKWFARFVTVHYFVQ